MWKPFKRKTPSVHARLKAARRDLEAFQAEAELDRLEAELSAHRRDAAYQGADPSVRQRMDVEQAIRDEDRDRRRHQDQVARREARRALIRIPDDAAQLMSAAHRSMGRSVSQESVVVHAQESILESVQLSPFAFETIASYRGLMQVPTLIRELWPYKPTILRTQPMLDFARWVCRVIYEECPTAKGLVKGKTNYVMRNMRAKVSPKDENVDAKTDGTTKLAQKYIDQFLEQQEYTSLRRERLRRMMIEGEAFLWIADSTDLLKVAPTACYVEPDFIRPSQKESANQEDPHMGGQGGQDWSWGVLTPKHQYWNAQKYQIVWNNLEEDKVSAKDMIHSAVRERSNIKRCLPPMLCISDDLIRITLLRAALAEASQFRAGIGGVVKYEQASVQAVKSWAETVSGGSLRGSDRDPEMLGMTTDHSTNMISLPPGRDFVKGPDYPEINSLKEIYAWHTRAVAVAEQVPEWLVSGESAGSSFASSLTSESSSIIEFEAAQEAQCGIDKKVLKRVLQAYIDKDHLPKSFWDNYDVSVEGESMLARDLKGETETAVMAVDAKLCSRHTASTQLGFNPDREKPMIEAEGQEALKNQQAELSLGVGPSWVSGPKTMSGEKSALEAGN